MSLADILVHCRKFISVDCFRFVMTKDEDGNELKQSIKPEISDA